MTKPIIEIEDVSKLFRLGALGHRTLRDALQQRWTRLRRKTVAPAPRLNLRPEQVGPLPNSFWAVRNISAEIRQGEIVGIIGRNGAGKSTLLKILSKITAPTEGRVVMRGRVGSLLEVGAGFHPELNGLENIFLNGAILGMKKSEIERKLDEIVAFADVGAFIDTPVKRYSSGMYVRLAFAVAAHLEPDILIVDEVLAVGDARFQKKCLGKMREISSSHGRTVIFVSHNLEAVQRLCSHCILLDSGRLLKAGATQEVVSQYLGNDVESCRPNEVIHLASVPREGTGEARFVRARFSSGNALAAHRPYSDGPLDFTLSVATDSPIKVQSLALGIRDQDNRRLVNVDLGCFGETYELPPGFSDFHVHIDALHLRPGTYNIALWLARFAGREVGSTDVIDYIEKAFEIEVVEIVPQEQRTSIGPTGVVTCNFKLIQITHTTK